MTKHGWHYLFALLDSGDWDDDRMGMYEMDAVGCGEIDGSAFRIIPKRRCPNCGREMVASWDDGIFEPSYSCSCGTDGTAPSR